MKEPYAQANAFEHMFLPVFGESIPKFRVGTWPLVLVLLDHEELMPRAAKHCQANHMVLHFEGLLDHCYMVAKLIDTATQCWIAFTVSLCCFAHVSLIGLIWHEMQPMIQQ